LHPPPLHGPRFRVPPWCLRPGAGRAIWAGGGLVCGREPIVTGADRGKPADLGRIRHAALDMDGTLYRGHRLFDAAIPLLDRPRPSPDRLRRLAIGYTFLTNNTSLSKADYVEKLRRFGIEAAEDQIATPADATIAYLRERLPHVGSIAILGTPSLCRQFEEA